MKNKHLLSLLFLPFLSSCVLIPRYDGPKVQVHKSMNPGLNEYTPDEVYEHFITNSNSGLLFISSSTCSACIEKSPKIDAYAKLIEIEVLNVVIDNITLDGYQTLKSVTEYSDSLYALPSDIADLYVPEMILFLEQEDGAAIVDTTYNYFVQFMEDWVEAIA
jgi:hypothetical protein